MPTKLYTPSQKKTTLHTFTNAFAPLYNNFTQLYTTLHNFTNKKTSQSFFFKTSQTFTNTSHKFLTLLKVLQNIHNFTIRQFFTTTLQDSTQLYTTSQHLTKQYTNPKLFKSLQHVCKPRPSVTTLYTTLFYTKNFERLYYTTFSKLFKNFSTLFTTCQDYSQLHNTLQHFTQLYNIFTIPYRTLQ